MELSSWIGKIVRNHVNQLKPTLVYSYLKKSCQQTKAKVSIFILKTLEKTYAQIRTDLEMNIKTKYITTS